MRILRNQANSRNMGWLLAGVLVAAFSSSTWALDFDKEIARQERTTVVMITNDQLKKRFQEQAKPNASSDLQVELVQSETVAKNR